MASRREDGSESQGQPEESPEKHGPYDEQLEAPEESKNEPTVMVEPLPEKEAHIQLEGPEIAADAKEVQSQRYWYGLTKDCRWYNISVGGVNFPIASSRSMQDPSDVDITTLAPRTYGIMTDLTDLQVDRIKDVVNRSVVVWKDAEHKLQPVIRTIDDPAYKDSRYGSREVALGKYLYLVRVKDLPGGAMPLEPYDKTMVAR